MTTSETIREAHRLILHMQVEHCRANCPGGLDQRMHEATCAEASEWLEANPVTPPFPVPVGSPKRQKSELVLVKDEDGGGKSE